MKNEIIPKIKHSIEDFLFEEEGNITRNKILTVGSMMILMGIVLSTEVFAGHSSHKSHSSHSSHSSGSSGGHSSHVSHSSHTSSASTHSSHGNTAATHSNATPVPTHTNVVPPMPSMSGVALKTPPNTEALGVSDIATSFALPDTPKIK